MDVPQIFALIPSRYIPGSVTSPRTFYFSVGEYKYLLKLDRTRCTVEAGPTTQHADVVLKTTPALFERMVLQGKLPGPLDVALGKVKTNDPLALRKLRQMFDLRGL